jgi:hypothetical protein
MTLSDHKGPPYASSPSLDERIIQELADVKAHIDRLAVTQKTSPLPPGQELSISCRRLLSDITKVVAYRVNYLSGRGRIHLEEALDAWDELSTPALSGFDATGLALALSSHWKLRLQPRAEWQAQWFVHSRRQLAQMDDELLVTSLYAVSMLGMHPPEDWMQAWHDAACARWPNFNEQAFSNASYALAGLSLEGVEVPAECREVITHEIGTRTSATLSVINQLHAVTTLLQIPEPSWLAEGKGKLRESTPPPSRQSTLEQDFFSHFKPLVQAQKGQVSLRREVWSPKTCTHIDAVVKYHPRAPDEPLATLYLQLDGISHFIKNDIGERMLDGPSRIQSAVLQSQLGPTEGIYRLSGRHFAGGPEHAAIEVMEALMKLAKATPAINGVQSQQHKGRGVEISPDTRSIRSGSAEQPRRDLAL